MALGTVIKKKKQILATRLSAKFDKLWVVAEIFLFVLVGASVEIESLKTAGISAVIRVLGVLVFRMLGVFLCMIKTNLNTRERLFSMFAYLPKATVQAAIGGIPLAAGLACGDVILTTAVLAIVVTAPLGAFAIDTCYTKLLNKE